MDLLAPSERFTDAIKKLQRATGRNRRKHSSLSDLRDALNEQRKTMIGSYASLEKIVRTSAGIDEDLAIDLSGYLAYRTVHFWNRPKGETEDFCFQFYELAVYSLASGKIGNESVDDIIQLANCLIRSRDIFVIVEKELLPEDLIGSLFGFVESYDDTYFTAAFEDAVLGAISVLLGVVPDPLEEEAENEDR